MTLNGLSVVRLERWLIEGGYREVYIVFEAPGGYIVKLMEEGRVIGWSRGCLKLSEAIEEALPK